MIDFAPPSADGIQWLPKMCPINGAAGTCVTYVQYRCGNGRLILSQYRQISRSGLLNRIEPATSSVTFNQAAERVEPRSFHDLTPDKILLILNAGHPPERRDHFLMVIWLWEEHGPCRNCTIVQPEMP